MPNPRLPKNPRIIKIDLRLFASWPLTKTAPSRTREVAKSAVKRYRKILYITTPEITLLRSGHV